MPRSQTLSFPLPNGSTWQHEFTVSTAGAPAPDFTNVVVRADWRTPDRMRGGVPLLRLSSATPATADGSAITIRSAGSGALTFRIRLAPADTLRLPFDAQIGADVELVFPGGDVSRLLRLMFHTDGSFTHA